MPIYSVWTRGRATIECVYHVEAETEEQAKDLVYEGEGTQVYESPPWHDDNDEEIIYVEEHVMS